MHSLAEEAIGGAHDLRERHARYYLRIDQPLQDRGQDGRGNTFAGDVGDHHGQPVFIDDHVEEVAADVLTRQVLGAQAGVGKLRDGHGHQPLLDLGRDAQLLLIAPAGFFRLRQVSALH